MDAMTPSLLWFGEHGCRWCNEDWWSSPWSGLQDEDLEFAVFGQTICHHIAGGTTYERSLLSSSLQFMTRCRATCLRRRYNRRYGMGVGRRVRRSLQRFVRRRRREVLETSCRGPWRRYLLAQTQGNPRSLYPRKTVTGTLVENLRIGTIGWEFPPAHLGSWCDHGGIGHSNICIGVRSGTARIRRIV